MTSSGITDGDAENSAKGALGEGLGVWLLVTALATALVRLAPAFLEGLTSLAVAILFLGSAMRLAGRRPGGLRAHGMDLDGVLEAEEPGEARRHGPLGGLLDLARALVRAAPGGLRETAIALGLAGLLFPPYALAWALWNAPGEPFSLRFPPDLLDFAAGQLVVVALPEEAFFRGWLQTRLRDAFPRRFRCLGAEVWPGAIVVQALLFGAVHAVVDLSPARAVTFFPGLLFGWLRAWRGGIGAAIVLHALSNLCAAVLSRSFG